MLMLIWPHNFSRSLTLPPRVPPNLPTSDPRECAFVSAHAHTCARAHAHVCVYANRCVRLLSVTIAKSFSTPRIATGIISPLFMSTFLSGFVSQSPLTVLVVSKHPKLAMSPLTCRSSVISLLFFLASCWLYGLREWNCFHLNAALFSRPRQLH